MSDTFRIALMFPDKSGKYSNGKAKLGIDAQAPVEAPFDRGPAKPRGTHIVVIDTYRSAIGDFSSAGSLRITAGDRDATFRLPDLKAAMKALDTCEKDLLIDWGMDPAAIASIATIARGRVVHLFSVNDYPTAAWANGQHGTVGVRFLIDTSGKVTDCRVVESSGYKLLDDQTCRIMEGRARFEPARTAGGEAVASLAFQRIRWELP